MKQALNKSLQNWNKVWAHTFLSFPHNACLPTTAVPPSDPAAFTDLGFPGHQKQRGCIMNFGCRYQRFHWNCPEEAKIGRELVGTCSHKTVRSRERNYPKDHTTTSRQKAPGLLQVHLSLDGVPLLPMMALWHFGVMWLWKIISIY